MRSPHVLAIVLVIMQSTVLEVRVKTALNSLDVISTTGAGDLKVKNEEWFMRH